MVPKMMSKSPHDGERDPEVEALHHHRGDVVADGIDPDHVRHHRQHPGPDRQPRQASAREHGRKRESRNGGQGESGNGLGLGLGGQGRKRESTNGGQGRREHAGEASEIVGGINMHPRLEACCGATVHP